MKSSLPSPTKPQKRRLDLIKGQVGCVACRLDGYGYVPADAHHMIDGGRRISHDHTIPLCPWHHRGVAEVYQPVGTPSLALEPRLFHEQYGSEYELLEVTNLLLKEVEESFV